VIADLTGIGWAIGVVGGLTLLAGVITAIVMVETRPVAHPAASSSAGGSAMCRVALREPYGRREP
jgi:hypothetical protein